MNASEIKTIEDKLEITLPLHYVRFLMHFEGFRSADPSLKEYFYEDFIYTTPERIIEANEMMGFYSNNEIIKDKLIIGDNGGGDYYLIDLQNSNNEKVYFLDHEESFENNFDLKTNSWNWDGLEYNETLGDYKKELQGLFGLE